MANNTSKKKTNISKKTLTKKKPTNKKRITNKTHKKTTQNKKNQVKKSLEKKLVEEKKEIKEENIVTENKSKPKKSKKLLIVIIILSISISVLSIFLVPRIIEFVEISKIKREINQIIDNKNIKEINEMITKNISSGEINEVEKRIEKYALDVITISNSLDEIKSNDRINNALLTSSSEDNEILSLYEEKEKELDNMKNLLTILNEDGNKYKSKNNKVNKLYKELKNKIDKVVTKDNIDDFIIYLNKTKPPLKYLKEHKDYYDIGDNEFIFKKRRMKEEYEKLIENFDTSIKYSIPKLVDDKTPPVIEADDIVIYVGNSVNVKDKVKCVDEVDEEVECNIEGTFNSNKIGEYSLKITSIDKSNNNSEKSIKVIVRSKPKVNSNMPYYIEVIRNQNVVVVYSKDSNNQYTKIAKVFVASVGRNGKTPTGTYKTTRGYEWGALIGGVYGQYTTRITGSYLFHSVPYYSQSKGNLEWEEYNKLGTAASAGCVRLAVRDAKWIYDNIGNGTVVKIYDGNLPSGVTKPSATKISSSSPNRGWDPTDPDPNNPW